MTGTLSKVLSEKGFGLIEDGGGQEYFFHHTAVTGWRIEDFPEGDPVDVEVGEGPKGPRAENVRRTST